MTAHQHHFGCPETPDHATPPARHADLSPHGAKLAFKRDEDERRHKATPYTGRHRGVGSDEDAHNDFLDRILGGVA